jgi:hypothetical protein
MVHGLGQEPSVFALLMYKIVLKKGAVTAPFFNWLEHLAMSHPQELPQRDPWVLQMKARLLALWDHCLPSEYLG